MTEAIAFDTHRFVKRLTDSGFTEKQAETLAEEHVALLNGNLATKADIEAVRGDVAKVEAALKADIEAVRGDVAKVEAALKADIAKVEAGLKADIAKVEAGLKADIAKVEGGLKADIAAVKADLLKWMFGAMIAQGGLIVALVKLL